MTTLGEHYQPLSGELGRSDPPAGAAPAPAAPRVRRSSVMIATGAVLGALWLGLTAPAVSPVAGPPTAPAVATAPAGQDVAPPAPAQPPAVVQQPIDPGDHGDGGRR